MKLEEFCSRFHNFLGQEPETPQIFKTGQQLLGELLSDARWFWEVLQKLVSDSAYLEAQPSSVFANEKTLHRSPDRSFSVLAYIWEPRTLCEIHDHGSWGLIGSLVNEVREVRYRRLDDGQVEGYARLEESSSKVIKPGAVIPILPLDKGIHTTGAAADERAISVGVYGRSIRQGYIQFFYPSENRTVRAYSPKLFKKVLAVRALASAPEIGDKGALASSLLRSLPEYLVREFELSLSKSAPNR